MELQVHQVFILLTVPWISSPSFFAAIILTLAYKFNALLTLYNRKVTQNSPLNNPQRPPISKAAWVIDP